MTYQLYRLAENSEDRADSLPLGGYVTFAAAMTARDADTVRVFSVTPPGQVMVVHHDIVGPGADGPFTTHPVSTAVERRRHVDLDDDVEEIRGWLARVHAFTT
jgi:hypothetical protein